MNTQDLLKVIELAAYAAGSAKRVVEHLKATANDTGAGATTADLEAAEQRGLARAEGVIAQADQIDARLDAEDAARNGGIAASGVSTVDN